MDKTQVREDSAGRAGCVMRKGMKAEDSDWEVTVSAKMLSDHVTQPLWRAQATQVLLKMERNGSRKQPSLTLRH